MSWYPIGELSTDEDKPMNISNSTDTETEYEITGLKPSTRYFIVLYLSDMCGNGNGFSTLAETALGEFNYSWKYNYTVL